MSFITNNVSRILVGILVVLHFIWAFLFWFIGHILYRSFTYCEDVSLWGCSDNVVAWIVLLIGDYAFIMLCLKFVNFIYDKGNGNLLGRTVNEVLGGMKTQSKNGRRKKIRHI